MAIYVTSDAHGHVRALDEALSKISLTSDDTLYVLGDMIDRGPDPVGVIKLVRSLPNAHVLKGNHEQIMLDAIIGQDPLDAETWDINGGWTTREQLNDMEFDAYEELVRWMAALPLYAVAETEERPYLLVHAGIEMKAARAFLLEHGVDCADGVGAVGADRELLQQMLAVQSADDLLWIRHGYWDAPTGLLSAEGKGPVVVSGHTPRCRSGVIARSVVLRGSMRSRAAGRSCAWVARIPPACPIASISTAPPPPAPSSAASGSCGSMMGRSSTRTSTRANNRCKW